MTKGLFFGQTDKKCRHCIHATRIDIDDRILCPKRGIVQEEDSCQKYRYDPLKRVPRPKPVLPVYHEDEFKL